MPVVQWGNVPSWVAAVIAAISAYLSYRSQRKSKAERDEARAQADRAERAAAAAERQADAADAQQRRDTEVAEDAEIDPWELDPIVGRDDVYLINTSETAKYDVTVSGIKIHNGPAHFDLIGPGRREQISIMRFGHPDDFVEVTWRRRQDNSGTPQTRQKIIPSRI